MAKPVRIYGDSVRRAEEFYVDRVCGQLDDECAARVRLGDEDVVLHLTASSDGHIVYVNYANEVIKKVWAYEGLLALVRACERLGWHYTLEEPEKWSENMRESPAYRHGNA